MTAEWLRKPVALFLTTLTGLTSVTALAFSAPQAAVDQCIGEVAQKYAISPQHLELNKVRARPIGAEAAVIYLRTAAKPNPAQRLVRIYCTINQQGNVTQLRANPRLRDVTE